jgi:eukaryotic-like serine/threonine-protein kinase
MKGGRLGHFLLLEKIGEGGMGQVYKARDMRLDRLVAIKLLPDSKVGDPERRARFVQEAKAASALNHPHIVTIHEIAEHEEQTFIVMELIHGKALSDLISPKGMRLDEALSIGAQTAGALATAHAAGIVHRDIKPGNIMVDGQGRVKVLDFGLAKLTAAVQSAAAGNTEVTKTLAIDEVATEAGAILGSVPYMSPEQAEGKAVDARSDIFSFGAVLYEMITGQRAFRGESRISTLAAVVEKEPRPASEIHSSVPPELERVIARCLRKDVQRRSQNMADVKLALEELLEESQSGRLRRAPAGVSSRPAGRRSLWPAVAIACVLTAVSGVWVWLDRRGQSSGGPDLVRLSPDDFHSYDSPGISPDGKFVAYESDRRGKQELWLQQVGGGDPVQLTHSAEGVVPRSPTFLTDGTRILYEAFHRNDPENSDIEVIPTLGGQPSVLVKARVYGGLVKPSPDGKQIVYLVDAPSGGRRLMLMPSAGGRPRELTNWAPTQCQGCIAGDIAWAPDSRHLISVGGGGDQWDWYALPLDGGAAIAMGAGAALRAAGLKGTAPDLAIGDRILFAARKGDLKNVWEIHFSSRSWQVTGTPRELSFGIMDELPGTISAAGTIALAIEKYSTDFYLIPTSPTTGQPTGVTRRLTQDGRSKLALVLGEGDARSVYFGVSTGDMVRQVYAVDLESGKQTLLIPKLPYDTAAFVSNDGRQIAFSVPDGDSFSIRIGEPGADLAESRVLCKACGLILKFTLDDRFLVYSPGRPVKPDPNRKEVFHLLEVSSGKDRPWLEHATDSITGTGVTFGQNSGWTIIHTASVGSGRVATSYLVPWREQPVPQSEWIELKVPLPNYFMSNSNCAYFFQDQRAMTTCFDPAMRHVSKPEPLKFLPGSDVMTATEMWRARASGIVFQRSQSSSSIWLMKLPD